MYVFAIMFVCALVRVLGVQLLLPGAREHTRTLPMCAPVLDGGDGVRVCASGRVDYPLNEVVEMEDNYIRHSFVHMWWWIKEGCGPTLLSAL